MQIAFQTARHAYAHNPALHNTLKYKPLFHIFKKAFLSTEVKLPSVANSLRTPPFLLSSDSLKQATQSILTTNPRDPITQLEKGYIEHYLENTLGSPDIFTRIKELELTSVDSLQKFLFIFIPKKISSFTMLENLHKVDIFDLSELYNIENLDLNERCPKDLLPKYLKVFHKQAPDFIERLLLKGLIETFNSNCFEEESLFQHIKLISKLLSS